MRPTEIEGESCGHSTSSEANQRSARDHGRARVVFGEDARRSAPTAPWLGGTLQGPGRPPPLSPLTHRPSKDQATIARLQKEIDELKSRLELVAKHSPVEQLGISHPSVDTQASVSGGVGYFGITYTY